MIRTFRHIVRQYFEPQAQVLMYHRIAAPETDVWDITVSPENFESHLQVLKTNFDVLPLKNLVENHENKKVKKQSIAITFDDGYADNFFTARPLLEKYDLPATFFISSFNIGKEEEFWWDELQNLILFTQELPAFFSITIHGKRIETELNEEAILDNTQRQKNSNWRAFVQPPESRRCHLYLQLWEQLKPLPYPEQKAVLQKLWQQVNINKKPNREAYKSLSEAQVCSLSSSLFEIGSHTVTHPALACHNPKIQYLEMLQNKRFLQGITGQQIKVMSYPYGNYNSDSIDAAKAVGFNAAFTTDEQTIKRQSHGFKLGRFQVKNIAAETLARQLHHHFAGLVVT